MRFTGLSIAIRPEVVLGVLLLAGVGGPLTAIAAPEPGLETLLAYRRIQCTVADKVPVVYGWTGSTYSRVRGEPDRRLFKLTGMNIRQCVTVNDPKLGQGFRMVTREVMIYQDPQTGAVLDSWENPWTGETVEVLHVENDPVNQGPFFVIGRNGKPFALPFESAGDKWWLTSAIPLFYTNPLGGDYQEYVGGTYQATEMFNFFGDVADLAADAPDSANFQVGWVRISDWLPWMKMRGRSGMLYFHSAGRKLETFEQLPEVIRDFIDTRYPKYREPPPVDDTRRNETSWTYFRKRMEQAAD